MAVWAWGAVFKRYRKGFPHMKRVGGLWSAVNAFDNLLAAYRLARAGKRRRPDVAAFTLNLDLDIPAQLLPDHYRNLMDVSGATVFDHWYG